MKRFSKIYLLTLFVLFLSAFITPNIYPQLVNDFRVNDDTSSNSQFDAKVGIDIIGNVTAVWRDQRNNKPNVYCQRFNSNGLFTGQNFKVNLNPDSSGFPAVAVIGNGTFGVCWIEINGTISNSSKVKFRLFDNESLPLTGEITVNDSNGNFTGPISICAVKNREFVITWSQKDILFQKINSDGNKIGSNQKVNDDSGNYTHKNPDITVRNDGSFIIVWNDTRPPGMDNADDIYMQIYDKFGNRVGVNQKVNDDMILLSLQHTPKISSDSLGNFVIAWNDDRITSQGNEVFIQKFSINGSKIGTNFRITQSSVNFTKGLSSLDIKQNGEFIVSWTEFRNFLGVPYFQRFRSDGSFIGNNFPVTAQAPSTEKFSSDVNLFNDRIFSVWTDARNGPFDVYCNIRSFTNPDTTVNIVQTSSLVPESFLLHQNYPNPFNPVTNIKFDIIKSVAVKVIVYDALGKEVGLLLNENLIPGSYKVDFDGAGFASGIYYYKFVTNDFTDVKKMLLIK